MTEETEPGAPVEEAGIVSNIESNPLEAPSAQPEQVVPFVEPSPEVVQEPEQAIEPAQEEITEPSIEQEPEPEPEETTGEPVTIPDINDSVLAFVAGRIVHQEAINVPFDRDSIAASVQYLKSIGKLNSDGSRVWV